MKLAAAALVAVGVGLTGWGLYATGSRRWGLALVIVAGVSVLAIGWAVAARVIATFTDID